MNKRSFASLIILLLALLLPVMSLAASDAEGRIRVIGYCDDRVESKDLWAPVAILTSKAHEDDLYLEYRYCRFDAETRVWQLKLVNKNGKISSYSGKIDIIFPYPNKWSDTEQSYWKWTRKYSNRFKFACAIGYSKFAYEVYDGQTAVAGYFIGNPKIRNIDGDDIKIKKTKKFPFQDTMTGFFDLSENDDYGHRISFRADAGKLPSVCIKIYQKKPKFDECQVKDLFTFLGFTVNRTIVFDGFLVDTRPEAYKYDPRFRVFLERRKSTLY